jgi:cbb3-type cytochrome oxidase subunit 3
MGDFTDPPVRKSGKKWWIVYMAILALALLWFCWMYWPGRR